MSRKPQAKDITDDMALDALAAVRGRHGVPTYSSWFDVRDEQLEQFPRKVVLAKLASLIRRGVIRGCTCGCRGDFELMVKS